MGLDKDDEIVKRRMAQKMQFLAEDVAAAREPTAAELKSWYEQNSDQFAQPGRVSFRHLYFSPDRRGGRARDDARAGARAARRAASGCRSSPRRSPIRSCSRTTTATARRSISRKEFGPQFALAVAKLAPGSWQGPIESGFGWHLVFVDTLIPGRVPAFEEVEADVKSGVARRAEGDGVGEGVQGHAREVHGAAARAGRERVGVTGRVAGGGEQLRA